MRFPTLLACAIILCIDVNAQMQKGDKLLEGSVNWNSRTSENENPGAGGLNNISRNTNSNYSLSPKFGVFVSESLLIGAGLGYEYYASKNKLVGGGTTTTTNSVQQNLYSFNPYVTRYGFLVDKLYFSLTGNLLLGIGEQTSSGSSGSSYRRDILEYEVNISPGLTYFLSDRWAMRSGLGKVYFNHSESSGPVSDASDEKSTSSVNSYGLTGRFNSFTIGFQYFFINNAAD